MARCAWALTASVIHCLATAQGQPIAPQGQSQPTMQGQPLPNVEVTGSQAETMDDGAMKTIVVGRREIARFGAVSLADVLRKLPGVSIMQGANGAEVRLRGLGAGYTQILIDGVATSPSFTLDSVSPETVERIEIMRGVSVEYGSQSIAGSINVVLKQAIRSDEKEFKGGLSHSNSQPSYHVSTQVSKRFDYVSWSMAATADKLRSRQYSEIKDFGSESPSTTLVREGSRDRSDETTRLSFTSKIVLQATDADRLSLEAFFFRNQIAGSTFERNITLIGAPLPYENSDFSLDYLVKQQRLSVSWDRDLTNGGRFTARMTNLLDQRDVTSRLLGRDPTLVELLDRRVLSGASDKATTLQVKYGLPVAKEHELAAGLEGSRFERNEDRLQNDLLAQANPPLNLNEIYASSVTKFAAYAQDQWALSSSLDVYFGVRLEGFKTDSTGNVLSGVSNSANVVSPALQVKWKQTDEGKDLLRFALGRTYKAPTPAELMPRRYIAKNNGPITPDFQGNPMLQPELAWSADITYERKEENGTLVGTVYAKRISGVMREEVINQQGTWITRPINGGDATLYGFELEGQISIKGSLGKALLRASLARNWSQLDQLSGPDNNLALQVPLTATLSADFEAAHSSWSGGVNVGYVGGAQHRLTVNQSHGLDLYLLNKLTSKQSIRFSVQNLFSLHEQTTYRYFDQTLLIQQSVSREINPIFRVDLELKF
jgi:outer membrane receptor for ferrienterochelin and colicins